MFNLDADHGERHAINPQIRATNLTHSERHLLHTTGWKEGAPLVPALTKAAAALWVAFSASRKREGEWTSEVKVAGSHALTKDGRAGCKNAAFESCFACCDSGAFNCHCPAGSVADRAQCSSTAYIFDHHIG